MTLEEVTEGRGLWCGVLGVGVAEGSGRVGFCEQEARAPRLDGIEPYGSGATLATGSALITTLGLPQHQTQCCHMLGPP